MSFLWGSKPKLKRRDALSPGQQDIFGQLTDALGQKGGGTATLTDFITNLLQGSGGDYENFAAPFMQQWQEQLLPQIEERYAGGGALSSSGFGQALSQGSAGLQANLANLYSQSRQQGANQLMQLLQTTMGTQPYFYTQSPGSPGAAANLFGSAFNAFSKGAAGGWGAKAANMFGS